ncbi:MAG: toprim domain-containing protein, partial [Bacillota bacterium]
PAAGGPVNRSRMRRLTSPVEMDADDQKLLGQVIQYYHQILKNTPAALAYLEKRGLRHGELVDHFKIGFADRSLGLRIPSKDSKDGVKMRERLTRLGIYRASGHEHFTGSVVFPIMDNNGIVTGIYGRKIGTNLRAGTPLHLYLPGPHKGFFNPRCLISPEVILCEAIIDAQSFWVHDFRNVTSSYGTGGFTDEMFRAFLGHGVRRVYNAYDPDPAGDTAAEQLAARLIPEGIECLRLLFPPGLDANAFVCADPTHARQNLTHLIQTARPMGNGHKVVFSSSFSTEESKGENPAQGEAAKTESPVSSPLLAASERAAKEEKVDEQENAANVKQAFSPCLAVSEEAAKEEKDNEHQTGTQNLCNRSVIDEKVIGSNERVSSSPLTVLEESAKEKRGDNRQTGAQIFCNRSVTGNQNGESDKQFSSPSLAALEKTAKEENVDEQKNAATVTKTSSPSAGQEETAKGRIGQGVYA